VFHGIFTPIVTPFKQNEEIDYGKMKHNLELWGKTDLTGIVVLGSNGEFPYLSWEEKLELVECVRENFNSQKQIIVGTTCESTRETIKMSRQVADLGADAVLILPPCYFKGQMTDNVLFEHFTSVAEQSPVPLMLYNMPANTGINLTPSLIARLAKHPNIVGIKDTSGNIVQIAEIVRDTDEDFTVFAGNAGYLMPALSVGARGATLALANILPEECCRLVSLFRQGDIAEAQALQLKMIELNSAVTGRFGISGLKKAMDLLGYQGGVCRKPLLPISEQNAGIVEEMLRKYGALK